MTVPTQSPPTRRDPDSLGPMPHGRLSRTVDELTVMSPLADIFELAARVEEWPTHLAHYRYVRFRDRTPDGGGLVEMSANRPFGWLDWPTWWVSEMRVLREGGPYGGATPSIRFRHVAGITTGMDVEWSFHPDGRGVRVRIVHLWDGPRWPLIGRFAARRVIGPVFVHGIASRTLAGLAAEAERRTRGFRVQGAGFSEIG